MTTCLLNTSRNARTHKKNPEIPSNAEFIKDEAVITWRDVEGNMPFKVLQLDEVATVNGNK